MIIANVRGRDQRGWRGHDDKQEIVARYGRVVAEIVYPPVIGLALTMFRALGLRFDVSGAEHIPTSGGAVIASNHVSYLDFIFVGLAARPSRRYVRFMAKDAVFRHRVAGPLMRGMHHIPVDRTAGAASYVASPAWLAVMAQVPTAVMVTVAPERLHGPPLGTLKLTGRPELAVADTMKGASPRVRGPGCVKSIVWFGLTTVTVWVTREAAAKLALPAWSAWMTQEPVALKVTRLAPLMEHTELEPAAMEKVTVRPELAVAAGV